MYLSLTLAFSLSHAFSLSLSLSLALSLSLVDNNSSASYASRLNRLVYAITDYSLTRALERFTFYFLTFILIRSKPNTDTPLPGSQPEYGTQSESFYGSLEQICLPVSFPISRFFFSRLPCPAGRL